MSFIGASVKVPSNNISPNEELYTVDNAVCDKKIKVLRVLRVQKHASIIDWHFEVMKSICRN